MASPLSIRSHLPVLTLWQTAKLLDLLNYFRTNRYTGFISDIQNALLNIHLKFQEDRNRFSFEVYSNVAYHYYQYRTILFGFESSSFILNFIFGKHTDRVRYDTVRDIISHKLYVDNLVYTTDSPARLAQIQQAVFTELAGSFALRDWASNYPDCLQNCPLEDRCGQPIVKV